ncbi:peptidase [Phyllobacterium sp. 628]|nr:peptidase [Phyllobacterium sp. 628]
MLADGGFEDEAFNLLAPKHNPVNDKNDYDTSAGGSIKAALIDETKSVKRQQMTINGKVINYTAQSGHLIAYAPKDAQTGKEDAEAAIFYTAYTRDGLPKEKRPVTFLWNGGPGSASIWLHMGSWAPMRLKSDAPTIPMEYDYEQPTSLPSEENAITLLDKSDLVFVDPAGTGYSTAVSPHTNQDFWGTDPDAALIRDFITRYNNVNNRQTSPKYLYGESYGGIRIPIVADLLLNDGTARFAPDSSGNPQIALSGFILNSPLLDYLSNCNMPSGAVETNYSCAGYLPSYAFAGDFHKLATARGTASAEAFLQTMRDFVNKEYIPTLAKYSTTKPATGNSPWQDFVDTQPGKNFLAKLVANTGMPESEWKSTPNIYPDWVQDHWIDGFKLGRYDARMKLPSNAPYAPDNYIDVAFVNEFKKYMQASVNYQNGSRYSECCDAIYSWKWPHRGSTGEYSPSSIPDFREALSLNPSLKVLVLHGYEDIATPGFQTEMDLSNAAMTDRVPVKWFEGGHMIYNTEASRAPLKTEIDKYYDDPRYSLPPAVALSN